MSKIYFCSKVSFEIVHCVATIFNWSRKITTFTPDVHVFRTHIKMTTKTYKILKNELLGRYMVANKNLKEGELILKETPVFVGAQLNGPAKCFKCLKTINLMMCSFCDHCDTALMCNKDCDGDFHPDDECITLRSQKIKGQILAENPSVIFPLRCLLLNIYNPAIFEKILKMEPHLEQRRDTAIWRRHRISVEDVLKDMNFLNENDLKEEYVQKICGILDVNTFEVRPPNSHLTVTNSQKDCLRGLYLDAAMMAHNCIANTHLSVDDDFVMKVYAGRDIQENEQILFNYANVLQGNQDRQQHLEEGKYFTCSCKRCLDPSELGTEISSLICHKCRKGFLRFTELEKDFKIWQCSECKLCFKDFLISLAREETRRRIENLDPTNLEEIEKLHKKLQLTFHPNHYLLLELQQSMVGLYARLPTKINLNRKIDLCERLLSIFTKLEPGISRIKALTMYELQSAIVDISNKRYKDKAITEEDLIVELKTAETLLKDSVKYLLYEPTKSPEGRVAQMALNELKMLRNSIKHIQHVISVNEDEAGKDKKSEVTRRLKEKLGKNKEEAKKIEEGEENDNKSKNNDKKKKEIPNISKNEKETVANEIEDLSTIKKSGKKNKKKNNK